MTQFLRIFDNFTFCHHFADMSTTCTTKTGTVVIALFVIGLENSFGLTKTLKKNGHKIPP